MSLFRALKIRPFALMWSGQTISRLGDGLFTVALSWWVLEQTGSAAAMGFVQIFRGVPNLIFLLIGGVIADRLPRLRVMLVSDLLRGLLLVAVTILIVLRALQVWHIYIAALIFGFVDAFFQPAYAAVVPDVVPGEDLTSANSLTALSGQLAGIVGTAIGGVIVAIGGTSAAFGLDGLSFFAASLCVLPILTRVVIPNHSSDQPPNVIRELREGLAAVFGIPWLWVSIFLLAFSNMFVAGALGVAMPFLVKDTLHADSTTFGLILALFSVGAVFGAAGLGGIHKFPHRGLLVYGCWIGMNLIVALLGLTQAVWVVCLLSVLIGGTLSAGNLIWTNIMQELVPKPLLGRVNSVDQFGSFVLIPIGSGLVGWATGQFGAALVFFFAGVVSAGALSLGLLSKAVRTLE